MGNSNSVTFKSREQTYRNSKVTFSIPSKRKNRGSTAGPTGKQYPASVAGDVNRQVPKPILRRNGADQPADVRVPMDTRSEGFSDISSRDFFDIYDRNDKELSETGSAVGGIRKAGSAYEIRKLGPDSDLSPSHNRYDDGMPYPSKHSSGVIQGRMHNGYMPRQHHGYEVHRHSHSAADMTQSEAPSSQFRRQGKAPAPAPPLQQQQAAVLIPKVRSRKMTRAPQGPTARSASTSALHRGPAGATSVSYITDNSHGPGEAQGWDGADYAAVGVRRFVKKKKAPPPPVAAKPSVVSHVLSPLSRTSSMSHMSVSDLASVVTLQDELSQRLDERRRKSVGGPDSVVSTPVLLRSQSQGAIRPTVAPPPPPSSNLSASAAQFPPSSTSQSSSSMQVPSAKVLSVSVDVHKSDHVDSVSRTPVNGVTRTTGVGHAPAEVSAVPRSSTVHSVLETPKTPALPVTTKSPQRPKPAVAPKPVMKGSSSPTAKTSLPPPINAEGTQTSRTGPAPAHTHVSEPNYPRSIDIQTDPPPTNSALSSLGAISPLSPSAAIGAIDAVLAEASSPSDEGVSLTESSSKSNSQETREISIQFNAPREASTQVDDRTFGKKSEVTPALPTQTSLNDILQLFARALEVDRTPASPSTTSSSDKGVVTDEEPLQGYSDIKRMAGQSPQHPSRHLPVKTAKPYSVSGSSSDVESERSTDSYGKKRMRLAEVLAGTPTPVQSRLKSTNTDKSGVTETPMTSPVQTGPGVPPPPPPPPPPPGQPIKLIHTRTITDDTPITFATMETDNEEEAEGGSGPDMTAFQSELLSAFAKREARGRAGVTADSSPPRRPKPESSATADGHLLNVYRHSATVLGVLGQSRSDRGFTASGPSTRSSVSASLPRHMNGPGPSVPRRGEEKDGEDSGHDEPPETLEQIQARISEKVVEDVVRAAFMPGRAGSSVSSASSVPSRSSLFDSVATGTADPLQLGNSVGSASAKMNTMKRLKRSVRKLIVHSLGRNAAALKVTAAGESQVKDTQGLAPLSVSTDANWVFSTSSRTPGKGGSLRERMSYAGGEEWDGRGQEPSWVQDTFTGSKQRNGGGRRSSLSLDCSRPQPNPSFLTSSPAPHALYLPSDQPLADVLL